MSLFEVDVNALQALLKVLFIKGRVKPRLLRLGIEAALLLVWTLYS